MNTKSLTIIVTLMMLSGLSLMASPTTGEEPPSGGATVSITQDTMWDSGAIDGTVSVSAGVNLSITGDMSVATGSVIDVFGTLKIADSTLSADSPPSDLQWWAEDEAKLWLPTEEVDAGSGNTITIHSNSNYNLSGFTVAWKGGSDEQMDGESHSFSYFEPPLSDGGWLTFKMELGSYGELVIDRIDIQHSGDDLSFEATELDGPNWVLRGDFGFALNIAEGGSLTMNNATITGADVNIAGSAHGSDSWLRDSGPINLGGQVASIEWDAGGFNGSKDDHDILADTVASISLTGISNTGGFVDYWERQIPLQTLHFPGWGATYTLHGIGPSEMMIQGGSSSIDGTAPVADQFGPRVVEIGYANGSVWTESATISDINWTTAWGTYTDPGGPIPHTADVQILMANLPFVVISSITTADTAETLKRNTVTVTISNSGPVYANVPIECFKDDGTYADISPTYPAGNVSPGSTTDVEIKWYQATTGNATLSCQPMIPSQVTREGVLGGDGAQSQQVEWSFTVESESALSPLLIAFIVALIVGVLMVAFFATTREADGDNEPFKVKIQRDDELDELEAEFDE